MKESVIVFTLAVLVCLSLTSVVQAVLVDANEMAWMQLDGYQSVTCIAYYIPDIPGKTDSLIFLSAPEFRNDIGYIGDHTDWQTAVSDDKKVVYLYGPRSTNDSSSSASWFSCNLFFQWDTEADGFDPAYPVYIDAAYFDGGLGCSPFTVWSARGEPGGSWELDWEGTYYEGSYTNPVPEPMTILLLVLGAAFLRKRY